MTPISLYELNNMVKEVFEGSFTDAYWVVAEMSEVRVAQNGHCYIELVEKGNKGSALKAKARAIIWNQLFPLLKLNFEETTGQSFCAGLKVQLLVELSFNETYGYSLIVQDIDPTYTMGSLAQIRKEIIETLTREGVVDMNRQLVLPRPLQRIAIISSANAAGYGDFCNQIDNNIHGFRFTYKLFPAVMQGESTASSIIQSLDLIYQDYEQWDAVVIIRGGGAVSDLAGFENYELALNCAQFPLPIITGIGHDRDTTVVDLVANTNLKTPTAVAAFLIEKMEEEMNWLVDAESYIVAYTQQCFVSSKEWLNKVVTNINRIAYNACSQKEANLAVYQEKLRQKVLYTIQSQTNKLPELSYLSEIAYRYIRKTDNYLNTLNTTISLYSPDKLLKLGYTITRCNDKVVKDCKDLKPGSILETKFENGVVYSEVKSKRL